VKGSKLIIAASFLDCVKHWQTDSLADIKEHFQCLSASSLPKPDGNLERIHFV